MRFFAIVTVLGCLAVPAHAHFKLNAPASYGEQDPTLGNPQKSAPCGQNDATDPLVPTNAVTAFQTGAVVTVSINETVFHAGHYRVAIAQDQAGLPADPAVTGGSCGSAAIQQNPTLPVLADGQLVHTTAFSGSKTMQIQLPAGMECDHCVLQVVEFMSAHAPPCFYHHCATVTVSNTAPMPDAGVQPGDDAGTTGGGGGTSGGCAAAGGGAAGSAVLLLGLALLWRRKRA